MLRLPNDWASGAANSLGSSSNGRASAMFHGPVGDGPRTYQEPEGILSFEILDPIPVTLRDGKLHRA